VQEEIVELLKKRSPEMLSASDVALELHVSKSTALHQLKKLVGKGMLMTREGRYGVGTTTGTPSGRLRKDIEDLARLAEVSPELIYKWVEEVKARGVKQGGKTRPKS
jgi:predicted ArsR family transcriptional regulator